MARLIEEDYVEPSVGRARRLLEDQKALLPDTGGEDYDAAARAGLLSAAFLVPVMAPTALAAMYAEAVQRIRRRAALGRRLRRAVALVRELERFRSNGGGTGAAPYRTSVEPLVAALSPGAAHLVSQAEAAVLVRYWVQAPLPWRRRSVSGVALAAGNRDEWRLVFNGYTDRSDRAINRAMRVLDGLAGYLAPVPCPFEIWRWQLGELETSFFTVS